MFLLVAAKVSCEREVRSLNQFLILTRGESLREGPMAIPQNRKRASSKCRCGFATHSKCVWLSFILACLKICQLSETEIEIDRGDGWMDDHGLRKKSQVGLHSSSSRATLVVAKTTLQSNLITRYLLRKVWFSRPFSNLVPRVSLLPLERERKPLFQGEPKCEVIVMHISLYSYRNYYQSKNFAGARSLALKERLRGLEDGL